MVGIYKITTPSNKVYIGQSYDIARRWYHHNFYCNKDKTRLHRSILKYGWDNCTKEILLKLPLDISQVMMDYYEVMYMDIYKAIGFKLLNTKEGGSKGKMNNEQKLQLSKLKKGNTNMLGKKHSDETKKQMSKAAMGKPKSIGMRIKLSEARKKMKLSEDHKKNIGLAGIGRKHSEETLKKMSISGKKRPKLSTDSINKSKQTKISRGFTKQVLDTYSGKIYGSINEAAINYGVKTTTLGTYLHGKCPNKTSLLFLQNNTFNGT